MTSIEGSDSLSSISTDLVSNVFTDLIIHKPSYLSNFEHDFFRFCNNIISGLQKTKTIDQVFSIFLTFQLFSIICQPSVSIEVQKGNPDETFRFLFFFTNLYTNPNYDPSLFFFFFLDILMLTCVFFFILGLYLSFKKIYSNSKLQILYSIFVFNLSQTLFFISANYATRLICKFIILKENFYLIQTIISTIFFFLICTIRYMMLNSVHQVIIFQNYGFDYMLSDIILNSAFVMIIIISNFGTYLLSSEESIILQGLLFCFFGISLFYSALFPMNFHNSINSIKLSMSSIVTFSGILTFFQAKGLITNNHTVVLSLFFLGIFFYSIFVYVTSHTKRGILKKFEKLDSMNPDFDSLNIKNENMAITYLYILFDEASPYICNGSFINWLIYNYDSERISRELLLITSLVPIDNTEMSNLTERVLNQSNKSFLQKFVLFRHFIIIGLQTISHVPPKLKYVIKELKSRISQFQSINACLCKVICNDLDTNFLLIDSLSTMRNILYNNLRHLLEMYPNSPESLLLYQSYQSKIENNQVKSHKYTELVTQLCNGSILFRNFGYIQTFSSYPKIQRALFGKYSQNSKRKRQSSIDTFDVSSSENDSHPIYSGSPESYSQMRKMNELSAIDDIFSHFHSKSQRLTTMSYLFFGFLIISTLFSTFGIFSNSIKMHMLCNKEAKFIVSFKNCFQSYFMIYFRPLMLFNLYSNNNNNNNKTVNDNPNISINTNDHFILSQIEKVYHYNIQMINNATNFRNNYNDFSLNYPFFVRDFAFLTQNIFIIPSFFDGIEMNSTIRIFFTRISSSMQPFFKDDKTFIPNYSEKIKRIYTQSIIVEQFVFKDIILSISKGIDSFIKKARTSSTNSFTIYIIPLIISIILLSILPHFYAKIIKKSLKNLQTEKSNRSKRTIRNFLTQNFYSFKKLSSFYYTYLFLILVVELLELIFHQLPLHYFIDYKFKDLNYHASNDVATYYYATTPLTIFYLSNMSMINISSYQGLLQECFNYFTNSTNDGLSIDFSRSNFELYQYLIKSIDFISKNNVLSRKESDEFIELLDNSIFKQLNNKSLDSTFKYINAEKNLSTNLPILVSFVSFVSSTILIFLFNRSLRRFVRSLDALFQFLHYCNLSTSPYSRQRISSSSSLDLETSKLAKDNQHRTKTTTTTSSTTTTSGGGNQVGADKKKARIRRIDSTHMFNIPAKFVYSINNILDFVNKPCALIDLTDGKNVITATNSLWLQFFNCTDEYAIGRPYTDFNLDGDNKNLMSLDRSILKAKYFDHSLNYTISPPFLINIPICESTKSLSNISLLLINEIPIEEELNEHIENLQKQIINTRNNHYPRRFINRSEEGVEEIGFNVNVSLMLNPASHEDISSDKWVDDTDSFELWIAERCKSCDNVDILNRSCRELALLFGVNHDDEPAYLVLQAMTIACDALRWGVERKWKSSSTCVQIYAIVTCGDSAEFVFKRKNSSLILSMFGPSFSKEMSLREKIEPNSIIIDLQAMDIITPLKTGFEAHQIDEEAFIFSLPQESDLISQQENIF